MRDPLDKSRDVTSIFDINVQFLFKTFEPFLQLQSANFNFNFFTFCIPT